MAKVIGIDPGLTGAIALVGFEDFWVEDMPVMARGAATGRVKSKVNGAALYDLLRPHKHDIAFAVVEQVTTMHGQGVASSGSLMHTLGVIEGVLAAMDIRVHLVAPARWKKAMGLGSDKEVCRAKAIQLWPRAPLSRKADHNRAEALLLAQYGLWHEEKNRHG